MISDPPVPPVPLTCLSSDLQDHDHYHVHVGGTSGTAGTKFWLNVHPARVFLYRRKLLRFLFHCGHSPVLTGKANWRVI